MQHDMLKGLLGSLGFAVAGVLGLIFAEPSLSGRIICWATIVFFGSGAIVIAIRIVSQSLNEPGFHAKSPANIVIRQLVPADEEIAEAWQHSSPTQPLLSVTASKWKEISEHRWQVNVYLATLARDPHTARILDPAIYQALKSTRKVVDVHREDTEVWVVSGEPDGKDLVTNVGAALTQCIPSIAPTLLRTQKNS